METFLTSYSGTSPHIYSYIETFTFSPTTIVDLGAASGPILAHQPLHHLPCIHQSTCHCHISFPNEMITTTKTVAFLWSWCFVIHTSLQLVHATAPTSNTSSTTPLPVQCSFDHVCPNIICPECGRHAHGTQTYLQALRIAHWSTTNGATCRSKSKWIINKIAILTIWHYKPTWQRIDKLLHQNVQPSSQPPHPLAHLFHWL